LGALEDTCLERGGEHLGEESENVHFHGLVKQPYDSKKTDFTLFEIDSPYHVSERRDKRLLGAIADHVDIITASINDLDYSPKVATIVTIDCKAFNLKPVILSGGEGGKPVPWDQHLVLPKGFRSCEILAAIQPYEHALVHHPPLDDGVGVQGGMAVLQEHGSL